MLWFFIALPGLIFAYAVLLRPLLHKITAFQKFYAQADGFWSTVWALCGKSATMAWSYILGGIGFAFSSFDKLSQVVGAPDIDIQGKVKDALAAYPQIVGWVLFGISLITIWARLRGIMAAASVAASSPAAPAPVMAPAALIDAPLPSPAPGIAPTPVPSLGPATPNG